MGDLARDYTAGQLALATAALLVPFALALAAMWVGHRRRAATDAARYGPVPVVDVPQRPADGEALYTGTTPGGTRGRGIATPGLFGRGGCRYWIESPLGVVVQRGSGEPFVLGAVRDVGLTGAHAGRVVAPGRIAVIAWTLGEHPVDSGFAFDDAAHAATFAAAAAHAAGLPADESGSTRETIDGT